jgi:ABC-type bacteriocin transporter
MRTNTLIRQHDITDCGAACLASVAAHYQLHLPIARIRQYAGTDKRGTNVLGLVEAAHKLGFQAKGVKGTVDSLQKIPKPAIAHVVVKQGLHHYVVVYEATATHIRIMDPADGRMHRKTLEEFGKEWTGVLVLLLPEQEMFQTGNQKFSVYRRFWFLLQPHHSVMVQTLVGAVIYTLLGLSTSIFIQKITDYVVPENNSNLLNLLGVVMTLILVLQLTIGTIKSVFALRTGQQIDARLILGYYKHLLMLPQQFFDSMRVGEIISRINDAVKIRAFINDIALNILVNALVVVFAFGLMFTYYWKLALVMLAIIPFYTVVYVIVNQLNRRQQRSLMEANAELEVQLVESLNAVATIKRFGLESFANIKTENRFIALLRSVYASGLNSIYTGTANEFISRVFTIILLWMGTYYVLQQEITPGELLSFYALVGYFTGPAGQLITANRSIQEALVAADRLFEIMDLEREEQHQQVELLPELMGDIRFNNVSFRYGSRVQVFQNLTLTIPKGQVTAIVGESGSGKSTMLSLLQNLYPLQQGNITIGNFDIRHIRNDSLRHRVAVVPQQIDLFAGSLLENIALGDFEPDIPRVLAIAEQLGITEFVQKLPGGFGAFLGENGANLSGGQRQRIAIARALYRQPEILILDEATSSLDSISEQYVQRVVQSLREHQKTVLIIAHRLSTIRYVDQIVVLENGQLVDQGTHDEILLRDGIYGKLWKQQMDVV